MTPSSLVTLYPRALPPAGEEALCHRHQVLRQRARLVTANVGRAAHCLARRHVAHEVVVGLHPLNRVGEGDGDGQRQALGDSHHDDGDGVDEEPNLQRRAVRKMGGS